MAATSSFLGFGARFVLLLLLGTCCAQTSRMSVGWPLFRSKICCPLKLFSSKLAKILARHTLIYPYLMSSCEVPHLWAFQLRIWKAMSFTQELQQATAMGLFLQGKIYAHLGWKPRRLWNDYEMYGFWSLIASCMVQCVFLFEKACVYCLQSLCVAAERQSWLQVANDCDFRDMMTKKLGWSSFVRWSKAPVCGVWNICQGDLKKNNICLD